MNTIDVVLGIILLIALVVGFRKGLFVALASLIGVILGVYCAVYFSGFAAGYIAGWTDWNEQTVNLTAFAATFLIVVLLISLAGKALTKIADFAALGIVNKLLGAVFNVLKFALIISVVFMFVNASPSFSILSEEKREDSVLYTPVASLAPLIVPYILKGVDGFETEEETSQPEEISEEKKR
ncbi:CvpA family protein [Marinirhabdus gelatinilytica]|uniref:Membrane protein required for colicin V production n=1 Tax=Marinirhabdus gelatinilytica TaxID=1703343 RepID=A0A370QJW6_9FLAO|nr:CvpA family protein [Marinirhabdus gelatinilytica]RDK88642.1 membrane protein required for colicin V production [Marinirhabdus gelatinilytica]